MVRVSAIILMGLFLGGCIFAPTKYGARGFVWPGETQYQRYLANCRRLSPNLDAVCARRGDPDIIQVGHSAGIFAWRQPVYLLRVGSFGSTSEVLGIPRKWRQLLSDLAVREQMTQTLTASPAPPSSRAASPAASDVKTTTAEPVVKIQTLSYDPGTRKGLVSVEFAEGHYAEARLWTRKNIETLARDKNVALRTDEIPGAAKFYLGAERVKDGNVLEIEFETE